MHFRDPKDVPHIAKPLGQDISALAIEGRTLFCACDETATVERLIFDPDKGEFSGHTNFPLSSVFDLPGGAGGEMDIEGLCIDEGYLWITGSHSLKRDKPSDIEPSVCDLDDIDWDENRGFLGRVPLADHGDGVLEPVAALEQIASDADRHVAAMMKMGKKGRKAIRKLLAGDRLLKPFMKTPCKENGFDVEGLAVRGQRVFLGLRGPVLGAYAIIVELHLKLTGDGWLKPAKVDGARYKLHAVDLEGLGIRDMKFAGDDLLILGGPTQNIEGLQRVFAIDPSKHSGIIAGNAVRTVRTLEIRDGEDHAEGVALFKPGKKELMLIAHDSPGSDRYDRSRNKLLLDAFAYQ